MRYLKTYENVGDVKVTHGKRVTFYEFGYLKCEQDRKEKDVIQIFKKNSTKHFGFVVFTSQGKMLFEIRGHQSSINLTYDEIKEIEEVMNYFQLKKETDRYNL